MIMESNTKEPLLHGQADATGTLTPRSSSRRLSAQQPVEPPSQAFGKVGKLSSLNSDGPTALEVHLDGGSEDRNAPFPTMMGMGTGRRQRAYKDGRGGVGVNRDVREQHKFLYDQHRCRVCLPPLSVFLLGGGLIALSILLISPVAPVRAFFHLDDDEARGPILQVVSYTLLGLGLLLPFVCVGCCVWATTPSRSQRQRASVKADALLEELSGPVTIREHYDVFGPENASNGTVLILAGASCPRVTMKGFAAALGVHYKAISVDMPGHGSLVHVGFSLARCERVIAKVLERELLLSPGALSVSSAAGGTAPGPYEAPPATYQQQLAAGRARPIAASRLGGGGALTPTTSSTHPLSASYGTSHEAAMREMRLDAGLYGNLPMTPPTFTHMASPPPPPLGASYPALYQGLYQGGSYPLPPVGLTSANSLSAPGAERVNLPPLHHDRLYRIAESSFENEGGGGRTPDLSLSSPQGGGGGGGGGVGVGGGVGNHNDDAPPGGRSMVASAVVSSTVVVIAYGASAYVAAYLATRHPTLVAGMAFLGPVPDYNIPRYCTGVWESLYRLRWAASLVNLGIKGRVKTHPKASDSDKRELLSYDWHVGVLPDFIAEVAGRSLLTNLRTLPKRLLVLAPKSWEVRAIRMFNVPDVKLQATIHPDRGLKDDKLPTLNPAKLAALNSTLITYTRDCIVSYAEAVEQVAAAQEQQHMVAHARHISGSALTGTPTGHPLRNNTHSDDNLSSSIGTGGVSLAFSGTVGGGVRHSGSGSERGTTRKASQASSRDSASGGGSFMFSRRSDNRRSVASR